MATSVSLGRNTLDIRSGRFDLKTAESGLAKVHRMTRLGKPPSPFAGMGS